MSSTLELASERRRDQILFDELDARLDLLLAHGDDRFTHVTADPRKMGYLRFLLKHYAKSPHPWADCYKDNFKRFGPKTKGLCGVLKDVIRQNPDWRGKHPGAADIGAPGVAIGEADKGAAPAWGGHHGLSDALDREFGAVDHTEALREATELLITLGENCKNIHRVLIGLDEPPRFAKEAATA